MLRPPDDAPETTTLAPEPDRRVKIIEPDRRVRIIGAPPPARLPSPTRENRTKHSGSANLIL